MQYWKALQAHNSRGEVPLWKSIYKVYFFSIVFYFWTQNKEERISHLSGFHFNVGLLLYISCQDDLNTLNTENKMQNKT